MMAFVVSFVAGMNFFSLTNFLPTYFSSVYGADPVTVGIRNIGFPTGAIIGAVLGNMGVSRFPRHVRWILVIGSCGMGKIFNWYIHLMTC